jgi:ketosteroid isomerase-like protein
VWLSHPNPRADADMMTRIVFAIQASLRKEGRSVRRTSIIVVLVVLAALTPVAGTARQATPPPGAVALGPEDCRVPPRSPEAILSVLATPTAEPGAAATDIPPAGGQRAVASEDEFPTGESADPATAEAVEAVVREFTACFNARDLFRLFSLVSDDFLRELASESGVPAREAELAAAAAMEPIPVSEGDRQVILAIRDARVFPDGRVGVVLVGDWLNDEEASKPTLVVLVQTPDRWLVDNIIMVDPGAAAS